MLGLTRQHNSKRCRRAWSMRTSKRRVRRMSKQDDARKATARRPLCKRPLCRMQQKLHTRRDTRRRP
jgi:hypothetical protein